MRRSSLLKGAANFFVHKMAVKIQQIFLSILSHFSRLAWSKARKMHARGVMFCHAKCAQVRRVHVCQHTFHYVGGCHGCEKKNAPDSSYFTKMTCSHVELLRASTCCNKFLLMFSQAPSQSVSCLQSIRDGNCLSHTTQLPFEIRVYCWNIEVGMWYLMIIHQICIS